MGDLSFVIVDRVGFSVLDWEARGGHGCRPAEATEIELWAALQSEKARADAAEAELRASLEFVSRFTSGNNVPRDVRHLAVQAGPTIAQEATFLRDQINDAMNGANARIEPGRCE